jgi:hypothetical protein
MWQRLGVWLFYASGLIPLLSLFENPPNVILMYSLYVLAYSQRQHLQMRYSAPRLAVVLLLCCLCLEMLAWWNAYARNEANPNLFHPQLIPDLILSIGVYGAWVLGWMWLSRTFPFSLREGFWLHGLYGILIENFGRVLIAGVVTFPLGIVLWLYVLVAYGSTVALALLFFSEDKPALTPPTSRIGFYNRLVVLGRRSRWAKWVLTFALVYVGTHLFSLLWGAILALLQYNPSKRPISQQPW